MTQESSAPSRYVTLRRGSALRAAVLGALVLGVAPGPSAHAAEPGELRVGAESRTAVTLTIYNQDLGLVSERRRLTLRQGENRLALEDVSTALDPATVLLRGADFRLIEQSFAFDLITPDRLLEAAVGKTVRIVRTHPETGEETLIDARLLGASEGPVLQIGDRIETTLPDRIVFDRLPEGLRERPTLVAKVDSARAGTTELELSYLTGGLSWAADYVAELNPAEDRLDLTALVTLTNRSGADFQNATLRLLAGEVSRAEEIRHRRGMVQRMAAESFAEPVSDIAPQAVSDRYLYRIERPVDLANRETKQVRLFSASGVTVAKEYRFETLVDNIPAGLEEIGPISAAITLVIQNATQSGLGRPLPVGTVRVYRTGEPGGRLFVGADRIGHKAEGDKVELSLGGAFDITGKARRTALEKLSRRSFEAAEEITISNARDQPVTVRVIGQMPRGWKMLSESAPHERESAHRIVWTLQVPGKGATKLNYRMRVTQ